MLGGISVPGAAHAKFIMLLTGQRGRLLVGSGNLGPTGWGSAGEMFTVYDFDGDSAAAVDPFAAARQFLDGLCEKGQVSDFAAGFLAEIWARVPWLSAQAPSDAGRRHNLISPLMQQFVKEVRQRGSPSEVVLYAPFFDEDCEAVSRLLADLEPQAATLLVQPHRASVDPRALERLVGRFPRLVVRACELPGRPEVFLHAKFVLARFASAAVCLCGSANLSRAALLNTTATGNAEMANLLAGGAEAFDSLLSPLAIGEKVSDMHELAVGYQPGDQEERGADGGTVARSGLGWRDPHADGCGMGLPRQTRWLQFGPLLLEARVRSVSPHAARERK